MLISSSTSSASESEASERSTILRGGGEGSSPSSPLPSNMPLRASASLATTILGSAPLFNFFLTRLSMCTPCSYNDNQEMSNRVLGGGGGGGGTEGREGVFRFVRLSKMICNLEEGHVVLVW